jgi:hypothetical protein
MSTRAIYCFTSDKDFGPVVDALGKGATVILPMAGLGTGLSRLDKRAPKLYRELMKHVRMLYTY